MSTEALAGAFALRNITAEQFRILVLLADCECEGHTRIEVNWLADRAEMPHDQLEGELKRLRCTGDTPWFNIDALLIGSELMLIGTIDWQGGRSL